MAAGSAGPSSLVSAFWRASTARADAPAANPPTANAYAKPPVEREAIKELRGFVRDGVVEFTGEKFPDGVFVVVRRAR